ncbi:hypothetical protein GW17_00059323 [Ensete ventricosum]|nr:hypothetical protein GW17_00059323 [Ensete ventricosum]
MNVLDHYTIVPKRYKGSYPLDLSVLSYRISIVPHSSNIPKIMYWARYCVRTLPGSGFLSLVSKLRSCALSLLPFIIHTIAASLAIYIAIAIIVVIAIFHPLLLPPSANPRLLPSTPPAHSSVVTTAFCSPITTISTSPFFLPCHYCCLAAIFLPSSSVPVATCHCHLPFSSHYSHLYAVNPSATMLPCIVALPLLPPSYTLLCVALASVVIVPFLPSPTLAVDTPHQTLFLHCCCCLLYLFLLLAASHPISCLQLMLSLSSLTANMPTALPLLPPTTTSRAIALPPSLILLLPPLPSPFFPYTATIFMLLTLLS